MIALTPAITSTVHHEERIFLKRRRKCHFFGKLNILCLFSHLVTCGCMRSWEIQSSSSVFMCLAKIQECQGQKIKNAMDFPGGPVVKTCFHCSRNSGELRSHKPHGAGQEKKSYCHRRRRQQILDIGRQSDICHLNHQMINKYPCFSEVNNLI